MNPFIEVGARAEMLSPNNVREFVKVHDLVVDATDDLAVRYWIDDACADLDRPWVHAALYRDMAQLTVFWARYNSRFRDLYPNPSEAASCSEAGMLGAVASVLGHLQALECLKLIIGYALPSVGRLNVMDLTTLNLSFFQLPGVAPLPVHRFPVVDRHLGHSPEQLQQALSIHEPIQLLDLRSRSAFEAGT